MGNKALGRSARPHPDHARAAPSANQQPIHVTNNIQPFDGGGADRDPGALEPSVHTASDVQHSTDCWRSSDTSDLNNEPDDDDDDPHSTPKLPTIPRKRIGSATKVPVKKGTSGEESSDDDSDTDMTRQLNTRNLTISSLKPTVAPTPPPSLHEPTTARRPSSPLSTSGGKSGGLVHLAPLDAKSTQSFSRRKSFANQVGHLPIPAATPPANPCMDVVGLMELVPPPSDTTDGAPAPCDEPPPHNDTDDLATMELLDELMRETVPAPRTPKIESRKEASIREALVASKQQRSAGKGGLGAKHATRPETPPHLDATDEDIMNQILQERRPGTTPLS